MFCPYLKNRELRTETTNLGVKETTIISSKESFGRCIAGDCPYYRYNSIHLEDYCLKVRKETVIIIDGKGEIK